MMQPPQDDPERTTDAVPDVPQATPTVDEPSGPVTIDRVGDTHDAEKQAAPASLGRFVLDGEIGRGGMGCVLRARDPDLDRDLAVKVLLPQHRGQAHFERRFLEEARISGRLEHPGVPAVHELGHAADGRPFFAMKLIRGQTLAELLKERSDPAHELPRFLAIFEQVCQTIAYAHAHGVIHRDLKPANVMVGKFGEVQVMDWGLAKVLAEPNRSEECNTVCSESVFQPSAEALSQDGNVLGTPAYMAPEQARGQIDKLDERVDVFGLGAILCEVLTGQPPYVAEGIDVLLRAAAADLEDALSRLDRCGADAELVSLARACLTPAREARPRDAGEVARRVTAYRTNVEQRLRQAEVERAEARAKAVEARKRQRLTMALAAAVVLSLGLGGGGAWYLRQQSLERSAAAERLAALVDVDLLEVSDRLTRLGKTPSGQVQGQRALLSDARTALERAEGRLGESEDGNLRQRVGQVRQQWERARHDREMLDRLDEARLRPALFGQSGFFDEAGADRLYGEAFVWYGIDVAHLELGEAAKRLRGSALAAEMVDALDDWARCLSVLDEQRMHRLWQVAQELDDNPWRRRLRQAVRSNDPAEVLRLGKETPPDLSSSAVGMLARALGGAGEPARGLVVLREARQRRPDDFWLTFDLACACPRSEARGQEEAVRYFTAAVALRPDSAACHNNLGSVLKDQGKLGEAAAEFQAALRLRPDLAMAHRNLGVVLVAQGKPDEAVAEFNEALRLQPNLYLAYQNLGMVQKNQGRLSEAETALRAAIRLQPHAAEFHIDLAGVLRDQGKLDEAVDEARKAILLKKDYAEAHSNLGAILAAQNQLKEAEAAFREAARLRPDYAEAHSNLGLALSHQGKFPEAVVEFKEALRLVPDFADAHLGLGLTLCEQRKWPEAMAEYREVIRLKPGSAAAHLNLGNALYAQGKWPEALAEFQEALRLKPDYPEAQLNVGNALAVQEKLSEAIAAYRKAIRIKPDYADAHGNLGILLEKEGKLPEAVVELKEALRLNPNYPRAHTRLGNILMQQGKAAEAETAFKEALRLQPAEIEIHLDLGGALYAQRKYADAVAECREVIRLKPDEPMAYHHMGLAQFAQGKLPEAAAAYREALRLRPNYPSALYNLGETLRAQKKPGEAGEAFRKAIRLRTTDSATYYSLGAALFEHGKYAEAVDAFREAARLTPDSYATYFSMGCALAAQGKLADAVTAMRESIRLEPGYVDAHYGLGNFLSSMGKPSDAVKAYREAIRLRPDFAEAHCNLGHALSRLGQFRPALESLRRGNELGRKQPGWAYPSEDWVHQAERRVELDDALPALQRGDRKPKDAAEQVELAELCTRKSLLAAAVRFYSAAFADQADLAPQHGYDAACTAARAAAGQGKDTTELNDKDRAQYRGQALTWLRANLAISRKLIDSGKTTDRQTVQEKMRHWQSDTDLTGIRHPWSLLRLPADERRQWQKLWADVEALLKKPSADGK